MYPSDLAEGQGARLEPLLEEPANNRHAGGRPRKYRAAQTLDRRTLLRLAGKMPKAMEGLRTQAPYQFANDPSGLPQAPA